MTRIRSLYRLERLADLLRRIARTAAPPPDIRREDDGPMIETRRFRRPALTAGRRMAVGAGAVLGLVLALNQVSTAAVGADAEAQAASAPAADAMASDASAEPASSDAFAEPASSDASAEPASSDASAEAIPLSEEPAPQAAAVLEGRYIALEREPFDFSVGPDGRRAYVANLEDNSLSVVDLESATLSRTIEGGALPAGNDGCPHELCRGRGAAAVAVSPDERFAYVSSMREDAVAVVDLGRGEVVASIPVERFPRTLRLSADGKRAYVLNSIADSVSVLDLAKRKPIGRAFALDKDGYQGSFGRPAPLLLSGDGRRVYLLDLGRGGVVSMNAATRKKLAEAALDDHPTAMQLSPDGKILWVQGDRGLTKLDAVSLKRLDDYPYCAAIDSEDFALSPDGGTAAIVEGEARRVRLVDLASRKTVGLLATEEWPRHARYLPGSKVLVLLTGGQERPQLLLWDSSYPARADALVATGGETFCPAVE